MRRTIYYENPSKELSETVYTGQVTISTQLLSYDSEYVFRCNFNHIRGGIVIKKLDIELIKLDPTEKTMLNLDKIIPYSGMHTWDVSQFKDFALVADSLKTLSASDNPYLVYDYYFKKEVKSLGNKYIAKISTEFTEDDREKNIEKGLLIIRKSKFEIKALDAHSDASIILLPITGFTTVLIIFIKVFLNVRRQRIINRKSDDNT